MPAQPRYIQIETILGCDAECPFCPQKTIDRKPVVMSEATWKKIIDDTRGLGITYRPFLQNEALIDKRLAEDRQVHQGGSDRARRDQHEREPSRCHFLGRGTQHRTGQPDPDDVWQVQ